MSVGVAAANTPPSLPPSLPLLVAVGRGLLLVKWAVLETGGGREGGRGRGGAQHSEKRRRSAAILKKRTRTELFEKKEAKLTYFSHIFFILCAALAPPADCAPFSCLKLRKRNQSLRYERTLFLGASLTLLRADRDAAVLA